MFDKFCDVMKEYADTANPPVVPAEPRINPNGDGTIIFVRDGYQARTFPGPRIHQRNHEFDDLESYAAWLNKFADPQPTEILCEAAHVRAALAPRSLDGSVVGCKLAYDPTCAAWIAILGKTQTQKALYGFVRGNLESFGMVHEASGLRAGELLSVELAKLKVISGSAIDSEIDERGMYRYRGQSTKQDVDGAFPSRFTINVPGIMGVRIPGPPTNGKGKTNGDPSPSVPAMYQIEILLSMDVEDGECTFCLTAPRLAIVQHQMRLDAVTWLRSLLNGNFLVGLGALQLVSVPGIPVRVIE